MPLTRIAIRDGKSPEYIIERLGKNPGVRPEDVLISVVETPAENWSFGNGKAQFYKAA